MRALVALALFLGITACQATDSKQGSQPGSQQLTVRGNGGCYLGNGVYSGQRCPGQHP